MTLFLPKTDNQLNKDTEFTSMELSGATPMQLWTQTLFENDTADLAFRRKNCRLDKKVSSGFLGLH